MTIVATCGHSVDEYDDLHHVSVKEYDRMYDRAVKHRALCRQCFHDFQVEHAILHTKEQEDSWLAGED